MTCLFILFVGFSIFLVWRVWKECYKTYDFECLIPVVQVYNSLFVLNTFSLFFGWELGLWMYFYLFSCRFVLGCNQ